ncbi:F-box/LRR-repeat protein 17-like, partial [Trifolium medium]|nr:F-box/LRR-repeat protein 17-like [Trifolium medium]
MFVHTNLLSHVPGGIQFATAQLPLLELMDCGMAICDPNFPDPTADENDCKSQKTSSANLQ